MSAVPTSLPDTPANERQRRSVSWRVWAVALLPVLSMALTIWSWQLPRQGRAAVQTLSGSWSAIEASAEPEDQLAPGADLSGWKTITVPGGLTSQGLRSRTVLLRRRFEADAALASAPAVFVLGEMRSATARVFLNGRLVGHRGVPASGFNNPSEQTVFLLPRGTLREGTNDLALELKSQTDFDGILDTRLLLGPEAVLVPWASQHGAVRALQEQGGVLLLAFLSLLTTALWVLQGERAPRALYAGTVGFLVASGAYLMAKIGLLAFLGAESIASIVAAAVYGVGLFLCEWAESNYLGRVTWLRKVNRVVSGALMVLAIPLRAIAPSVESSLYFAYLPVLFLVMSEALWLFGRELVRRETSLGPLSATAGVLAVAAAVLDLLTDLGILFVPRLFSQAIVSLAVAVATTVIGEFMQMAIVNRRLSSTLSARNLELGDALTRAEDAARIKAEFLANTSHELRTPLNSIINIPLGLLDQLQTGNGAACAACQAQFEFEEGERFDPALPCPSCGATALRPSRVAATDFDPEQATRLLRSVVASGKHLLAVVNDILDYSKIDAGHMTLALERVDATELIRSIDETMMPVANRARVALDLRPFASGTVVEIDRIKVLQALINLVGNAIKFSDGKGVVTVTTAATAGRLTIAVADEGVGIAPENQQLIFEGFRQVESGNTRRFGGTGLGLAISRKIARLHEGDLTVKSALTQGSVFTLELPLDRGPTSVSAPTSSAVIVVIDDEPSSVDATAAALASLHCTVVGVHDPRTVLSRLEDKRPVLIVLDVMMPWVSGLEVLKTLRSHPKLSEVPVLVSSAFPENREAVEVMGARFLDKPWSAGQLLRIARELLGRAG